MRFALLRVQASLGLLALVSGCGGSSAGSGGGLGDSPNVVTFTITGGTPSAVATRVGSGSFTPATLISGAVTISLPSGVTDFAVAYVCPPISTSGFGNLLQTGNPLQFVFEASTLDGNSFGGACPEMRTTPATATLTGSVDASAIPAASFVDIESENAGFLVAHSLPGPSSSFSIPALAGSDRVLVLAYSGSACIAQGGLVIYSSGGCYLVAAKAFDNQVVPGALNGGNPVVLGASDEATPEAITYSNIPSGFAPPFTIATLITSSGVGVPLSIAAAAEYPAIPAAATQSGEFYAISTISTPPASGNEVVQIAKTMTTPSPVSFVFPSPWSYAGPTPAPLPIIDFAYPGFSGMTGVSYDAQIEWPGTAGTAQFLYKVKATGNSLNGASLAFPDLSGLTGFLAPPSTGNTVYWFARISQYSYTSQSSSPENGVVTIVSNAGTYTVP